MNEVRIKFLSGLGPTVRALPQNTNAAKVQGARAKYKSGSTQCLKITPKCRIGNNLIFWYFPPIFDLLKLTCLVTLFDSKL